MSKLVSIFAAVGAICLVAESAAAQNILFYGNSYTLAAEGVPTLVRRAAVASGRPAPNMENASIASNTLSMHLASNTAVISNPEDFVEAPGFQWDYVVLQDHSLRATNIPWKGDPTGFKNDVQALYGRVKTHSPNVTAVLYETWARSPLNGTDLQSYYPTLTSGRTSPYFEAADQMQLEIRTNYRDAVSLIGPSARYAGVGDAFQAAGYAGLYETDLAHPNGKGALMAALVIYQSVYQQPATSISYISMNSQMNLSSYGITSATQWQDFTTVAASVVPEPSCMALIGIGASLTLRRSRAK